MRLIRASILAGFLVAVAVAPPATAHAPLMITDETTSLACESVTGPAGTIRLTASVSGLSGPSGFLLFWASPADPAFEPPTLVSMGTDAAVGADGSLTATYDMYIPGDLGVTVAEPVFVGSAELTTTLSVLGPKEVIDEVTRNGNSRFRIQGSNQMLAVSGTASIPTGGTFELAGCTGSHEVLAYFATQPDARVSTIDRTRIDCFWATDDGIVAIEAQADENDVFASVLVFDASGWYFGLATPELTPAGLEAATGLDPDGSAFVSADFTRGDRAKYRADADGGWVMVTIQALSVAGTMTIDTSAGIRQLTMDDASCVADSTTVLALQASPGQ